LAVNALKLEDTIEMLNEVTEMEIYIEPHMNVYKNIILTGMDCLMFKPTFIPMAQILEEFLFTAANGESPLMLSDSQMKGSCNSHAGFLVIERAKNTKSTLTENSASDVKNSVLASNRPGITITKIQVCRPSFLGSDFDLDTPAFNHHPSNSGISLDYQTPTPVIEKEKAKIITHTSKNPKRSNPKKFIKSIVLNPFQAKQELNPQSFLDQCVRPRNQDIEDQTYTDRNTPGNEEPYSG
jgi:hypothetical protein